MNEPMDTETRMKRILIEYDDDLWSIDPRAELIFMRTAPLTTDRGRDKHGRIDKKRFVTKSLLEWLTWAMGNYRTSLGLGFHYSFPDCLSFQEFYDDAKARGFIIQNDGMIGKYRHLIDELEKTKKERDNFATLLEECRGQRGKSEYSEVKSEDLNDEDRENNV